MKSAEVLFLGVALAILERIELMEKALTDAIADLNTEVSDETTKLDSIKTYVTGVPGIVASAVATALANVGVEETAAAAQIETARQTAADSVASTLAAVNANTQPSDAGGSAGTGTTGSDTGGGTTGGDASGSTTGADAGTGTGTADAGTGTGGLGLDGPDAGTTGADAGGTGDGTTGTGTGDGTVQPPVE